MNRGISFCSNLFENKEVKPHFINERCFGEDLAKWLVDKLKATEFSFTEPYQEDWGWQIEAQIENETFFIQVGIMDESIGQEIAEWLISIETVRGWFSFGKKDPKFMPILCREIENALRTENKITDIRWQD